MKKSIYKKILFIIILIVLMFMISTESFASIVNMQPNTNFAGATQVKGVAEILLGILQVVAVAVAVIMLVVLAIKYMTASPGEKAEVKKSLTVYAIGALVLFASAGILNLIQTLADDVNKTVTPNINDGVSIPNVNGGTYYPTVNGGQSGNNGSTSTGTGKVTQAEWQDYLSKQAEYYEKHGTWASPEQLGSKYEDIYNRKNFYGIEGEDSQSSNGGITSGSDIVDWSQTGDGIYSPSGDAITPDSITQSSNNSSSNSSYQVSNHTAVTKEEWIEYQEYTASWRAAHGSYPNPEDLSPKYREIYERQRLYGVTGDTTNTQSYNGVTPNSSGSNNSSSQTSNNSSSNSGSSVNSSGGSQSSNNSSSNSSGGSNSSSSIFGGVTQAEWDKFNNALEAWKKENPGKDPNILTDLGPEYQDIFQRFRRGGIK